MPKSDSTQQKRLLEQKHILPYTLSIDTRPFEIAIYTKLGKLTGVIIKEAITNKLATLEEAKQIVIQLQKYNFQFEYLKKRTRLIRERDSIVAEKIIQFQSILTDPTIFSKEIQRDLDELWEALEIYKQQQRKMDIYQDDISLLNEKIEEQGTIHPEDWQNAESLSIAFAVSSYTQTIYLEKTRPNRRHLVRFYHNRQKSLPVNKRKQLSKFVTFLSDTHAGLVFDQIISLRPLLEKNLLIEKKATLTEQIEEFYKKYETYCHFFMPTNNKILALIRN